MTTAQQNKISIPKSDPRAPRILELARLLSDAQPGEHPDERAEFASLLRDVGVPENAIEDPTEGNLPAAGEVVLRTNEPPGSTWCSYEVLGDGATDIMVIRGALSAELCAELVETAEQIDQWAQGSQVAGEGSAYTGEGRTSRNQHIRAERHRFWGRWESYLRVLMDDAAKFYRCWNKHISPNRQDGWEVMRYEPGQRFGLHVDSIAGNAAWGQRQLSALLYLNACEGGETAFPRQEVEVQPEAGTLVLFPPFATHPHEARPPSSGVKYAVVGWFYP